MVVIGGWVRGGKCLITCGWWHCGSRCKVKVAACLMDDETFWWQSPLFPEWNSRAQIIGHRSKYYAGVKNGLRSPITSSPGALSKSSASLWHYTARGTILRLSLLYTSVWDLLMAIPSGTEKPTWNDPLAPPQGRQVSQGLEDGMFCCGDAFQRMPGGRNLLSELGPE